MMKNRKQIKKIILLVFIMMLALCTPMQVQAAKRLNRKALTLSIGESATLKLSGGGGKVKWKSEKSSVASVSSKGKVTGKRPGITQVSAIYKGKTYKCKVTVKSKFRTGKWYMGPEGGFLLQIHKVKGDKLVFSCKVNKMSCNRCVATIKKNGKTATAKLWCGDGKAHYYTFTWFGNGVRVKEKSNCFKKLIAPLGSRNSTVTHDFYTEAYWYSHMD